MRQTTLWLFLFHALTYRFDNLSAEEGYTERYWKKLGFAVQRGLVTPLALSWLRLGFPRPFPHLFPSKFNYPDMFRRAMRVAHQGRSYEEILLWGWLWLSKIYIISQSLGFCLCLIARRKAEMPMSVDYCKDQIKSHRNRIVCEIVLKG